jgi:aspartyl-tRNA(Asn)/glutamyl-tRNA(Gln) amidotransferase subunit C
MADLKQDDVLKLARLSKLTLSPEETELFTEEINAILGYVEQLQAVDVSKLKPTAQVTGLTNVMRSDTIIDYGVTTEALLKNLPDRDKNYIKVKRVLA